MRVERLTRGAKGTKALGKTLGEILGKTPGAVVVALHGELGAGKTVFAQGLAWGLGINPRSVRSPTYAYMNEYVGSHRFFHIDLYRVADAESLYTLGLMDALAADGICAVEWAERFPDALPADHIAVTLEVRGKQSRQVVVEGRGKFTAKLLKAMA